MKEAILGIALKKDDREAGKSTSLLLRGDPESALPWRERDAIYYSTGKRPRRHLVEDSSGEKGRSSAAAPRKPPMPKTPQVAQKFSNVSNWGEEAGRLNLSVESESNNFNSVMNETKTGRGDSSASGMVSLDLNEQIENEEPRLTSW